MSGILQIERQGRLLHLALNRPEKRNALTLDMIKALEAAVIAADEDVEVRVIVVTGAGGQFCVGLDLSSYSPSDAAGARSWNRGVHLSHDMYVGGVRLMTTDKPTIASVDGGAAGWGFELACLCDMRLVSARAKLAAGYVKRGVTSDNGGTWTLPRLIGWGRAASVLLRGHTLDAVEAERLGIADEVLPTAEDLQARTAELATEIARNAPIAVQSTKRLMRLARDESFEAHYERQLMAIERAFDSQDAVEGVTAFMEKRDPDFKGR